MSPALETGVKWAPKLPPATDRARDGAAYRRAVRDGGTYHGALAVSTIDERRMKAIPKSERALLLKGYTTVAALAKSNVLTLEQRANENGVEKLLDSLFPMSEDQKTLKESEKFAAVLHYMTVSGDLRWVSRTV